MTLKMILPQTQAPELAVPLANGGIWKLTDQNPTNFTLVTFYRGLHCPVCKSYAEELQKLKPKFDDLGVEIIAISMDTEKRATISKTDWDVADIPIGYGLTQQQAQDWSLYLSKGVKDYEPDLFSEPGVFLIRPNHEVYLVSINSQPFGRPHLRFFIKDLDYIVNNNYPARGEIAY